MRSACGSFWLRLTPAMRLNLIRIRRAKQIPRAARDFGCGPSTSLRASASHALGLRLILAALMPAMRLNPNAQRRALEASTEIPRAARDFGCGLPSSLRSGSRPQSASTCRELWRLGIVEGATQPSLPVTICYSRLLGLDAASPGEPL